MRQGLDSSIRNVQIALDFSLFHLILDFLHFFTETFGFPSIFLVCLVLGFEIQNEILTSDILIENILSEYVLVIA